MEDEWMRPGEGKDIRGRPLIIWGGGVVRISANEFFFRFTPRPPQMINGRPLICLPYILTHSHLNVRKLNPIYSHSQFICRALKIVK